MTFALNKQDGSLNVVLHSQYVIEKSLIDIPCNIQTSLSDREKRFYVVIFVRKAAVSSAGHPCVVMGIWMRLKSIITCSVLINGFQCT